MMFIEIEDLARQTTLLITISKEGSDQLRVGITPAPTDSKQTPTLKAISLVGTAAELDEGLADALVLWQAPKRSLAEQVRAAADDDAKPVATAKAQPAPAKVKGKPGPKPKNNVTAAAGDAAAGDAVGDAVGGDAVDDAVGGDAVDDAVGGDAVDDAVGGDAVDDAAGSDAAADDGDGDAACDAAAAAAIDAAADAGDAAYATEAAARDSAVAATPEPVLAGDDSTASHKGASQNHPTASQAPDGDDPAVDTFTLELF